MILVSACQPWLHLDGYGISQPIVSGGQAVIDAGKVAAPYPNLLAGHRSSHGSVFANLPNVAVGATFWTTGYQGKALQRWQVVARRVVPDGTAMPIVGWPLVLQTSLVGNLNLLLFCQPA